MRKKILALVAVACLGLAMAMPVCAEKPEGMSPEEMAEWHKSNWDVQVNESKLEKTKSIAVHRVDQGMKAIIAVRCNGKSTDVIVGGMRDYYASVESDGQNIKFAIDYGKVQNRWTTHDTGGRALFVSKPKEFIKELFGKQKLVVGAAPYNERIKEYEFTIDGLQEALEPFEDLCKINQQPNPKKTVKK